ncbi:hypothetical protein DB88DRAFT_507843 [Papiliotrema laurentii]|uniref:Uncharacterized protein n=1 Tax=Papiliotrema laurentii TaxID=5418 RepID=A0AAD9L9T2_PAPLA|nr:hypothetical protein DB88DRAFT_507843 [Papiliotrema laurentii]
MDHRQVASSFPGNEATAAQGYPQPGQRSQQPPLTPSPHNHQLSQPHLRTGPLDLDFLPAASTSQTSLLEAVVGPSPSKTLTKPSPPPPSAFTPRYAASSTPPPNSSLGSAPTSISAGWSTDASVASGSFGNSAEREWEIVSDVSGDGSGSGAGQVAELEKKVNKRRSNLPHLESELAALEAQIKAAEERIARAQSIGVQGVSAQQRV